MTTTLNVLFTPEEQNQVIDGIHKFIRLLGLTVDVEQLLWTPDESDLISALELVKIYVKESSALPVVVKNKTIIDCIPIEEVQRDMKEYLLSGHEASNQIRFSRNLRMYHLVINPVIQLFGKFTRANAVQYVDSIVDNVVDLITNSDAYGDHDDAVVAQEQVRQMISTREELRKTELVQKRKTPRRKKDWFVGDVQKEDDNCESALDFN